MLEDAEEDDGDVIVEEEYEEDNDEGAIDNEQQEELDYEEGEDDEVKCVFSFTIYNKSTMIGQTSFYVTLYDVTLLYIITCRLSKKKKGKR